MAFTPFAPPPLKSLNMEEVIQYLIKGKQRGGNMGTLEINARLDLQWPGLHTAPTSGKNLKILDRIQNIKMFTTKTPRKVMEKLAGSLQHASFGIPGGSGLFSPIQVALKGTSQWLSVTPNLTQCLKVWGAVIKHMGRHTTQVRRLVNNLPHYIGYSDSCGIGTGGVLTYGIKKMDPIM